MSEPLRLTRIRDGAVLATALRLADTFGTRLRGLMGRRGLSAGEGLWIEPCNSIHMMFVPFSIDVLFLRRRDDARLGPGTAAEVVKVCAGVRAWIGLAWCAGASSTVELPRGGAEGVCAGDELRLEVAA